jgi:hypothetical protein
MNAIDATNFWREGIPVHQTSGNKLINPLSQGICQRTAIAARDATGMIRGTAPNLQILNEVCATRLKGVKKENLERIPYLYISVTSVVDNEIKLAAGLIYPFFQSQNIGLIASHVPPRHCGIPMIINTRLV